MYKGHKDNGFECILPELIGSSEQMVLEEVEEETSNIRVRMENQVSEMIISTTLRIS